MKFGKTISNFSMVIFFACVGSTPFAWAQSAYTPIQFGHVHKPYDADSDQQSYSSPSPSATGGASSGSAPVVPSSSYSSPASSYSSTSTKTTSSSQTIAAPSKTAALTKAPASTKNSSAKSKRPASTARSIPQTPPMQTAVQQSPQQTAVQEPPQQAAVQEPPQQASVQESPQQSADQKATEQREVRSVLRGIGNVLRSTGVVNHGAYANTNAYVNNGAYLNNVAPIGAIGRNFSGKPTLVNGVPYLGGAIPSLQGVGQKVSISSLKEDFPLPAGKDDLETFENKQLAERANGGFIQRHYFVGTEGAGIIGRHGPEWHVGGR